jgi:hypothetical protein
MLVEYASRGNSAIASGDGIIVAKRTSNSQRTTQFAQRPDAFVGAAYVEHNTKSQANW